MRFNPHIKDLIGKYNKPGPRYTSYPTAPQFSDAVNSTDLISHVGATGSPVSLYLHIPFCQSNCWFCGCNTIITTRRKQADAYLDLLRKEVDLLAGQVGSRVEVRQIHFGGGTPNFLSVDQFQTLFSILRSSMDLSKLHELSVELAPSDLSEEQLDVLVDNGLTRASFGIQDVQDEVQKAINRIQPHEINQQVMQWLRDRGIKSVNVDLIYGLPYQNPDSYEETLDKIMELDPDRLAVFNYAHVPHLKPYQKKLENHPMPSPETRVDMLLGIIDYLTQSGYQFIGIDHFAKPDDELCLAQKESRLHRNFQGYTVQDEDEVIGLGISSISETPRSYRQNVKTFADYEAKISSESWPIERGIVLADDDLIRRKMIRSVMCNMKLDFETLAKQIDDAGEIEQIHNNAIPALHEMEKDGLIRNHSWGFEVTETGRLFLRNISMIFDAYLGKSDAKYSRTV